MIFLLYSWIQFTTPVNIFEKLIHFVLLIMYLCILVAIWWIHTPDGILCSGLPLKTHEIAWSLAKEQQTVFLKN